MSYARTWRRNMMWKSVCRSALLLGLVVITGSVFAQTRPLRLIVPFQPGGQVDIVARLVADKMSQPGRPVIVDNRPGAGGQLAMKIFLESNPDGNTLVMGSVSTMAARPNAMVTKPYDPVKDFAAVSLIATSPYVVVVNSASPIRSIIDLIKAAKESKNPLPYGTSGVGGGMHLTTELFRLTTGIKLQEVAYKGSAPATLDLLGGRIAVVFNNLPTALPHIKSDRLRALAITTRKRIRLLPDVPTVEEAGVPKFESGSWSGLVAPRETDPRTVSALYKRIAQALSAPDFRNALEEQGNEVIVSSPEEFAAFIKAENDKWSYVIRKIGLKL